MSSFMESLRRLSSGGAKEVEPSSGPTSPRNNVWSSTFDPGRNSNMSKVGASYYDKPTEENNGSVWDEHLKSASSRPKSFDAIPKPTGSGTAMDADSVRRMFSADKIESAMKQADAGSGKVDYDKFMSLLRSQ